MINALPDLVETIAENGSTDGKQSLGTALETLLHSHHVESLVSAGQITNGCVENTARTARDLDYFTVLLADGISSTNRANHDAIMTNLGKRLPCPSAEELARIWSAKP